MTQSDTVAASSERDLSLAGEELRGTGGIVPPFTLHLLLSSGLRLGRRVDGVIDSTTEKLRGTSTCLRQARRVSLAADGRSSTRVGEGGGMPAGATSDSRVPANP